ETACACTTTFWPSCRRVSPPNFSFGRPSFLPRPCVPRKTRCTSSAAIRDDSVSLPQYSLHSSHSSADFRWSLPSAVGITCATFLNDVSFEDSMMAQGVWANIRPMDHRVDPPVFSRFMYRYRNLVERFFNKLKH